MSDSEGITESADSHPATATEIAVAIEGNKSKFKILQLPVFVIIYAIFIFNGTTGFIISASISLLNIELVPWVFTIINRFLASMLTLSFFFVMFTYLEGFWDLEYPRSSSKSSSNQTIIVASTLDNHDSLSKHLAMVIILLASLIIGYLVVDITIETIKQIISPIVPSSISSFIIPIESIFTRFMIAVLIAPVFEEIIFRRYFQQALDRTGLDDWIHYVVQAIIFILIHTAGDIIINPPGEFYIFRIIFTGLSAVYFTWLVKKYQSLMYPILLHALFNLFILGLSIAHSQYVFYLDRIIFEFILILSAAFLSLIILILLITKANWWPKLPTLPARKKITKSNVIFILVISIIAGIAVGADFIFRIALSIQILGISISISILLMVVSFVLLIYWALKVNDLPWNLIYSIR